MGQKADIKAAIEHIIDPSNQLTLKENDAIRFIDISDDQKVSLILGIFKVDEDTKKQLNRALAKIIKLDMGFEGLKITFEPLKKIGSIVDQDREIIYIGVASGKGGVGKSTVAANLAVALNRIGKKTALIDADIYGSSIPNLLDLPILLPSADADQKIIPFKAFDIEVMATEFFLKDDQPLMWRGPMLGKMLNHFFYDVKWHQDTEFIVVDLPPGTGDVAMDIQKIIPACEMLVVTTPHPSAANIAMKAGFAAKQLEHNILGVIENMHAYTINQTPHYIFGQGGGKTVADKLGVQLLAEIPIDQPKTHKGIYEMHEEIGIIYLGLANKLSRILSVKTRKQTAAD
jgi:ATP-binding protein involved in chromosome partitioning